MYRGNVQCLPQDARHNDPAKALDVYKLDNKMLTSFSMFNQFEEQLSL